MTASLRRRLTAAFIGLTTTATGCTDYRAPTLTGSNQVWDPNIEATALKDNDLAALSWPVVDNYMIAQIGGSSQPGCAIGVAQGGELTYLKGYGKAELGGADWGVSTMGAIGSASKTFTATAVMRMRDLGMLAIDDTVGDYLTTGNADLADTQIAALLDHSAGVGGPTKGIAGSPAWEGGSDAQACVDGVHPDCNAVANVLEQPRQAFEQYEASEQVSPLAPGQGVYSNVGYSVLGAIIDQLGDADSSEPYEEWVWEHVGNPFPSALDTRNMLSLALSHSWRADDIPYRAVGYYEDDNSDYVVREAFELSQVDGVEGWEGPAGGWVMTIGDLTRFAVALNTQQIVNNQSLDVMRFPWTVLDTVLVDYGMGVIVGTDDGAPYWHGGTIGGHNAAWMWWPEKNGESLAIALICNRFELNSFTLRAWSTWIADNIGNSAPAMPAQAPLPAVGLPAVGGRSWSLDERGGWQTSPSQALLPLSALTHDLVIQARAGVNQLSFKFMNGSLPLVTLPVATWSDPTFKTVPTDVVVKTVAGDVPVRGLVLEGSFDRGGAEIARMSVRGSLDARAVAPRVGTSAAALCSEIASTGAQCGACSDGSPTCLAFRYDNFTGRAVQ